jgi:signal transduction histidine kinase
VNLPLAANPITYRPAVLRLNPTGARKARKNWATAHKVSPPGYPDSGWAADQDWQHRHMTHLVARIDAPDSVPLEDADTPALFAAYPVASLLYGADGLVRAANPAALALFRCGTAQLVGLPLRALLPELREIPVARQPEAHPRVAVRRPDGNNFIARVHFAPAGLRGGVQLATIEDLTDHEQSVAAANKELESFMSAAGHDLRGPLRILKGFTDALDDECGESLSEEGKSFLREILRSTERMEGLIDALLALSRAGRAEMHCENLDLSMLADMALYDLRHAKNAREVEVEVQQGLSAWGDVRLMMVVLRTLLNNAWKYTGKTDKPLVRFYAEERDGRTWLCVSDNGAGFDMTHAERLFQPFTRLHRNDEFPGHGLGLATVRCIIRRHGGDIEAEAAVNRGATFRFWLRPPAD